MNEGKDRSMNLQMKNSALAQYDHATGQVSGHRNDVATGHHVNRVLEIVPQVPPIDKFRDNTAVLGICDNTVERTN
jgi:hypothetical protein